jgi:hypothetical protein
VPGPRSPTLRATEESTVGILVTCGAPGCRGRACAAWRLAVQRRIRQPDKTSSDAGAAARLDRGCRDYAPAAESRSFGPATCCASPRINVAGPQDDRLSLELSFPRSAASRGGRRQADQPPPGAWSDRRWCGAGLPRLRSSSPTVDPSALRPAGRASRTGALGPQDDRLSLELSFRRIAASRGAVERRDQAPSGAWAAAGLE